MNSLFRKPRFIANEEGSLTVETVIIVPILAWAILATYVFFDAFKTQYVSQKATFAVADMISRQDENDPITPEYMESAYEIFDYMMRTEHDNAIRVSVITFNTNPATGEGEYGLFWSSEVEDGVVSDGYDNVDTIEDRIPAMSLGEQLIFVESEQNWSPVFGVGLGDFRFREVALARPRFATRVCWEETAVITTC